MFQLQWFTYHALLHMNMVDWQLVWSLFLWKAVPLIFQSFCDSVLNYGNEDWAFYSGAQSDGCGPGQVSGWLYDLLSHKKEWQLSLSKWTGAASSVLSQILRESYIYCSCNLLKLASPKQYVKALLSYYRFGIKIDLTCPIDGFHFFS